MQARYRNLTDSELTKLCNSVIYKYDQDRDGKLSFKELCDLTANHNLFKNLNPQFLCTNIDTSEDNIITRDEFYGFLKKRALIDDQTGNLQIVGKLRRLRPNEVEKIANEVMYRYDKDWNGVLSKNEIGEYFKGNEAFKGKDFGKLLRQVDIDHDCNITKDELKRFLGEFMLKNDEYQFSG